MNRCGAYWGESNGEVYNTGEGYMNTAMKGEEWGRIPRRWLGQAPLCRCCGCIATQGRRAGAGIYQTAAQWRSKVRVACFSEQGAAAYSPHHKQGGKAKHCGAAAL